MVLSVLHLIRPDWASLPDKQDLDESRTQTKWG